ncbi:MAG: M23 family metallopeptidase [Defluviitaleaceae bacterium]|nr:M23 family metallopeptidase [Defluviitaleaceae bacterium]
MEEKPRGTRNLGNARGKGFYVAMYSSLAGLLVLAVAIGYYNFIGFGSLSGDTYVADMSQDNLWQVEAENYPVGNNWDIPLADHTTEQPPHTPPPDPQRHTPSTHPTDEDNRGTEQNHTPQSPSPSPSPQTGNVTPSPSPQTTPRPVPEGADDDDWDWELGEGFGNEIHLSEDDGYGEDIFSVFDPAESPQSQTFAHFTEDDTMHWPVLGDVVMDFAMDRLVYDITLDQWRTNDNVAIAADRGEAVRAAASGVVTDILESRQFGPTVVIDHGNGWVTTYSQLDPDTAVSIGDVVTRGQIIGNVGSPSIFGSLLGYHVNFAVTSNEAPIDPNTLLSTAD